MPSIIRTSGKSVPGGARTKIRAPRVAGQAKRKHPAEDKTKILEGSGFLKYLEAGRAHAIAGSDAYGEAADIMSLGIRKSSKIPGGLDRLAVARSIRRGLNHASTLELELARTLAGVASRYRGFFGDPGTLQAAKRGGLDPNK